MRFHGWASYSRFANKNRTRFDGQGSGFDVTDKFSVGLELDDVGYFNVAMDLAVDDDGVSFDLSFDACVFADGERTI